MIELALLFAVLAVLVKPLGIYIALVYSGRKTLLSPLLLPLEKACYKLLGMHTTEEMGWTRYASAMLMFSLLSFALLYALILLQPLEVAPHLAFNIAVSFITNTNWQSYTAETTLTPLTQMLGLTVQQFASCACGMAVAVALFRSFTRKHAKTIGNFWVDMVRSVLYILLPMALIYACVLALSGVPQTLGGAHTITTLEGAQQNIPTGMVASQTAIKQLGTNGGGFYTANSAHPFENPTPLTNALHFIAILLLPIAFVFTFGVVSGHRRQSTPLLIAMLLVVAPFYAVTITQEAHNMAGKEMRFAPEVSGAWGVSATITGNGSANAAYGEFEPLSLMQMLLPMMLGEITFGGVGSGMSSLLMYMLVTVFIGGLMVGRTPELMGKKLGAFEVKLASLIMVIPAAIMLIGAAIAVSIDAGREAVTTHGIRGFTEILYGFTSAGANNGSAMGGLAANTPFYNTALGIAMFLGRYFVLISSLALAGALAQKNIVPASAGTLPTHGGIFIAMLLVIIVLVGVLNYVPALALGPLAEFVAKAQ